MQKICKNSALLKSVEAIKNNKYTEKIISVSNIKLLNNRERFTISEIQGNITVYIKFTAMQKLEVTYENSNFGLKKETIVAGVDAIRYRDNINSEYSGEYLDENCMFVEFVGECSKTIESIKL